MDEKPKEQDFTVEEITEAGDIGNEQMPAGGGGKTDKAPWNFAADKADIGRAHSDHRQEKWKPGAGM